LNIAGPIIQAIAIDCGIQTAQTANRVAIYHINLKALSRINTALVVTGFLGQVTGTAVGNRLYALGGWSWVGGASMGFLVVSLLVCFSRGPREKGWVGWNGGWNLRQKDLGDTKTKS
jgi:hypothetical protein